MATSGDYAAQVFASEDPHWHPDTHVREPPSPIPSSSASSLDATRHNERPSIELRFSNSGAKIVNAVVVGPAGRPLDSITSDSKHTNCSVTKTILRWPPSIGIALIRAWFFVGINSSAKSGCRVLGPKPSRCSYSFHTLATQDGTGSKSALAFSCTVIHSSPGCCNPLMAS